MASHHSAIERSCNTTQGSSDDVEPQPSEGTPGENICTAMDVYIAYAEPIYPAGDLFVMLFRHEKSFIAGYQLSSKVCSVASATIAKVIDTTSTTQDGRKVVRLYDCVDSEVDAFRCIFSVLHYTDTDSYKHLSAKQLLHVAKINSILDCGKALAPWICLWCHAIRQEIVNHNQPKTEELGMLLSSAITFEAEEEVVKLKAFASHHLPINFPETWRKNRDLENLHEIRSLSGLHSNVTKLVHLLSEHIHSLDGVLISRNQVYTTGRKLCPSCGRQHPGTAKMCHPCREIILWPELCSKQHRIGEYLRILTVKRLWPPSILFKDDASTSQIVQRVTNMSLGTPHHCGGGTKCPLLIHINGLVSKIKRTVDGFVPGVEQGGDGKEECNEGNGIDASVGGGNDDVVKQDVGHDT